MVFDVRGYMCRLCIVNLYTAWTEVMFDGNNLNEINPDVFPDPSACILRFILLTLFNYIVKKYLAYFLYIFGIGMLITEAKFGDVLDFEIIEQTSCKIGER